MPSTLVAAALGGLLAAALLEEHFDGRAVTIVIGAAVFPDLDVFADLVVEGLHNALLHNVFVPSAMVVFLLYDTRYREHSWLKTRYGHRGVRVAWVAVVAYVVPGIFLDLLNLESAAPLWPLHDRFYSIVGRFEVNNHELIVWTFVEPHFGTGPLFPGARRGTVSGSYAVPSFVNPGPGPDEGIEQVFFAIYAGWELLVVLSSITVLTVRFRLRSWGVI